MSHLYFKQKQNFSDYVGCLVGPLSGALQRSLCKRTNYGLPENPGMNFSHGGKEPTSDIRYFIASESLLSIFLNLHFPVLLP